jgi:hypothetical protein
MPIFIETGWIQSKFERRFDDSDESQRYEKYGSRASFIRNHRPAYAMADARQQKIVQTFIL